MTRQRATDPMASLYPFLYADRGDLDAVLTEVQRSTVEKIREVTELRTAVVGREAERLAACAADMARAFTSGGRLFAFGNGGSATDAQDLASLFVHPGRGARPLPAFGLTSDVAVLTALSNDVGFEVVYARQIAAFTRRNDIAVGLSTSGNSENLLRGFDEARRRGLLTVGIAGGDGGRMATAAGIDHLFVVPSPSVHRIQEVQTTIYHVLWELTASALSPDAGETTTNGGGDNGGDNGGGNGGGDNGGGAPTDG
jgi:D-sedoheptulose 7-phosphate isomerase